MLGLAAGCTGGGGSETATTADDTAAESDAGSGTTTTDGPEEVIDLDGQVAANAPESLAVTSRMLYRNQEGQVTMRGVVENTGDRAFSHVRVTVRLQNDQGDTLFESADETESEELSRLEPGDVWQFRVPFEDVDQITSVAGYIALDGTPVGTGTTGDATATDSGE